MRWRENIQSCKFCDLLQGDIRRLDSEVSGVVLYVDEPSNSFRLVFEEHWPKELQRIVSVSLTPAPFNGEH